MPMLRHVQSTDGPPFKCITCQTSASAKGFWDLGAQIVLPGEQVYGSAFVCASCFDDFARQAGWLSPEKAAELVEAEVAARGRAVELEEELALEQSPDRKYVSIPVLRELLAPTREPAGTRG